MSPLAVGWRNWRSNLGLVPLFYGVKLVLALLFTLPIFVLTSVRTDYSSFATPLVTRWDMNIISELLHAATGVGPTMIVVLFSFIIIAFVIKQFLNGGLYSTFVTGRCSRESFLSECARQTGSNFKISVFMLPIYLLLVFTGAQLSRLIPLSLTGYFGQAATGGAIARIVLVAAFVIIGILISESLRIHRAAYPLRSGKRRIQDALNFLRQNGVRLYGYYMVYLLPFVAIWLLIELAAVYISAGMASGLGVLLELLLFQICACVRTGQSLLFTATAAPIFRTFPIDNDFAARETAP